MLLRRKSDNETPTCQAPVFLPESDSGFHKMPYFPDAIYFINYIVLWLFIMVSLSPPIVINDCQRLPRACSSFCN